MATYASIRIQIDSAFIPSTEQYDNLLRFSYRSLDPGYLYFVEQAATTRYQSYRFAITSPISEQVVLLYNACVADFGTSLNFSYDSNSVTITATSYDDEFIIDENYPFPDNVSYTYTPNVPEVVFKVTEITAQSADVVADRNTKVRYNVSVVNGDTTYAVRYPLQKPSPDAPPYLAEADLFFDWDRNQFHSITAQIRTYDSGNNTVDDAFRVLPTVDLWYISDVSVSETSSGATITANIFIYDTPTGSGRIETIKEYSIDNIDWQESNVFNNVIEGNYTLYARDNYGALFTSDFDVVGVDIDKPEPVFEIPTANPLRFIKTQEYDCTNVRNWDNCLLYELQQYQAPNIQKQPFNQLIADCDEPITQILTNYDNVVVSIKDCEGVEVLAPTATVKKEYILQYDMRDAILLKATDGYTLVAFSGGDTYDPDTGIENGTYTNPNQSLFEEAINGTYFTISGAGDLNGTFEPISDYKDVSTGYWTIKLNVTYTSTSASVNCQCKTLYNEKQYNTIEFTTIGASLDSGIYTTYVNGSDDDVRYADVEFIGEPIIKIDSTYKTVAFDYSHSSNAENLDFTTGAIFRLRLEGRFFRGKTNEDDDSFISDDGLKTLQKSIVTRSYSFESGLIPNYIVEKLSVISGFSELQINGISYVKGEDAENNDKADDMNPFYLSVRSYQLPSSSSISEEVGIATQTQTAIGSTTTIAIGI